VPENQSEELAKYRLSKSGECVMAANSLLVDGLYAHSANRSYYAIFHAIRAVLALKGVDFKKHSAVISYFQQHFVKTNLFERKYSDYAKEAFSIRTDCDYEDFFVVSREDAEEQLKHARQFLTATEKYIGQ
jgi:uncharacterized protein (UPF0332 family)